MFDIQGIWICQTHFQTNLSNQCKMCDHKVLKQDSQKFPDRQGRRIFLLHCLIRNRILQLPYFRNCECNNNKKEIEECTFPTSVLGIYEGPLQTTSGLLNDLCWTICKSTLIIQFNMADTMLSEFERAYVVDGIEKDFRSDGRSCQDYRHFEVETGIVSNTSGSARLRLSKTDILVGVKVEIGEPHQLKPEQGYIEFFVDCSANASPEFEGRGGEELGSMLAKTLERAYNHPSAIDLESLCILPGKQCWVLYIDAVIGHRHVVDASPQEETCSLAQLLVSINGDRNICAMQKVGSGALDPDSIFEMIETAHNVGKKLNKTLIKALKKEESMATSSQEKVGFLL
ncbi:Exosome complex exonuclease RRP42 [Acropora cervicornis]|uniref:Ribosomal RNA-processing protein 42 n=1 Tax=Acropora cervicornis TaxID=6130 RepID=A0AAD9Q936_ACRCE|nr:Exosome complex exonuclease RRP42 [Acropora cervicornis]